MSDGTSVRCGNVQAARILCVMNSRVRFNPHHPLNLLLVLAVLPLALACAKGGGSQNSGVAAPGRTPAPSAAAAPVTITWSFWGDPQERSVDERIVTLFEKEHPEIHVQTRWTPYDEYLRDWKQWNAEGDPPDVAFLYNVPALVPAGNVADLTPLITASNYDLSDFYPQLLDVFRAKGGLYGLPRDNDTKVYFYNKDLFDAAHLAYPQAGWMWADLRRDALALTALDAVPQRYGLAFEPQDWWKLWVWQNGGEVFDDPANPAHLLLNSPQAVSAIRYLRDLMYQDRVTPPYDILSTSAGIGALFAGGRVGMAFGNHALAPLLASTPGLHWGVVGLPAEKQRANYAGGAGYVIGAHSAHPQAAWTFLTWLLSPKGEALFTESGLIVPSRRSVGNSTLFLRQGVAAAEHTATQGGTPTVPSGLLEAGRIFLAETEAGHPYLAFPGFDPVDQTIEDSLRPVWQTGADPGPILQALVVKVDAMLQQLPAIEASP